MVDRASGVDLGRVVEDDVEPHLDVVVVRGGHERGQLGGGVVGRRVLTLDGSERQRHVAPVAALSGIVLVDGQELDHRDAEGGQPWQLLAQRLERAWTRPSGLLRQTPHVQLVDDGRARRPARRTSRRGVTGNGHRSAPGVRRAALGGQPAVVTGWEPHLERPRVEEHLGRIEPRSVTIGDEPVHRSLGHGADPRVTVATEQHAGLDDRPGGTVELDEVAPIARLARQP